jgi:signal peptide peptidase SppA
MKISDIIAGEFWAILPDVLEGIDQYSYDKQEYEAAILKIGTKSNDPKYDVVGNGVAIIPVEGPISRADTFWSMIFGGTSVESITRNHQAAIEDDTVGSILFKYHSPGGTISGIDGLSTLISESSLIKPTVAYSDGLFASAAYWIGSAANKLIVDRTAMVGSIGVLQVHYDFSKADEQAGVKRTYLSAGKFKALGNDAEPLSEFAREDKQGRLDYYYTMFVDTVARNRGTDSQTVVDDMADGRIFIGQQALGAGLVDAVGDFDAAIEIASAMSDKKKSQFSLNANFDKGAKKMKFKTVEDMVAAYPEFTKVVFDQGAASIDTEKMSADSVKSECDRIFGFAEIFMGPENGKKFKEIVESGMTPEQYKIVAPEPKFASSEEEKDLKSSMLAAIKGAGAQDPGHESNSGTESGKDFLTLVAEYQAMQKSSKTEAMQAVMKANPEKHEAYLKSVN